MFHALGVAKKLGLGPDELCAVELGALFHDIGKIGIPEQILRKPDKLNDAEWAEMKAHPAIGANLLAQVPNLERIRPIVLAHHERYDGSGYPNGLKGNDIPLAAQIISVADTYQAMTSSRTYRPALTHDAAIRELRKVAGTQLNPTVVEAFIQEIGSHAPASEDHEREHLAVYERAVQAVRLTT
jgi:HD-GYP domain-containing protein (c-di-GMP phosphodiesterase class II)